MPYLPATPAGPGGHRWPTARASFFSRRSPTDPGAHEMEGGRGRERTEARALLSTPKPNHAPFQACARGSGLSSPAPPLAPPPKSAKLRPAGAKAQSFRSASTNLHHGASRSVRESQFQFFGSFRACGEGTAGRQCPKAPPSWLREHQEARRHSETSSRTATELRSRRRELQKDSSELQGTLPPPQRRSDRRRRG